MIQATEKCGCVPKKEDSPCSPCCASAKNNSFESSAHEERPPSTQRYDDIALCCPPGPPIPFERPSKIRSEIAEKGLPYKEVEAIINNNRLVIRTQTEPGIPDFEPACDCKDPPGYNPVKEVVNLQPESANRTVSLYPQLPSEVNMPRSVRTEVENPNFFLLKMRRTSRSDDKQYNIDFEFKTPRPWSLKKRLAYEEELCKYKTEEEEPEVKEADEKKRKKKDNSTQSAKKRKR